MLKALATMNHLNIMVINLNTIFYFDKTSSMEVSMGIFIVMGIFFIAMGVIGLILFAKIAML